MTNPVPDHEPQEEDADPQEAETTTPEVPTPPTAAACSCAIKGTCKHPHERYHGHAKGLIR